MNIEELNYKVKWWIVTYHRRNYKESRFSNFHRVFIGKNKESAIKNARKALGKRYVIDTARRKYYRRKK